jgi:hypothetical protein
MNKYDRRRKYYLVLDCETATLPYAINYVGEERKNIAIAKPLIYDLGWKVVDAKGNTYARKNFLISEIFSVPAVFDTAYYAEKRPLYLEKLDKGEIMLTDWRTAVRELIEDMDACVAVGAYNSMFDFKKAIPFTELYINQLYSDGFHKWLDFQNSRCEAIASGRKFDNPYGFDETIFRFRDKEYPLFDLWGLSCRHILNCDEYREMCLDNDWQTASGKYFKTSAETAFRFYSEQYDFIEAHTAIDDADIETLLFAEIAKRTKRKFEMGIIYFPFRELGTVERYRERTGRWY